MSYYTQEEEDKVVNDAFEDLMKYCNRTKLPEKDEMLRKAFRFAENAHRGARRKSGEPYILHPIAVAKIVAQEIGLGSVAVAAALLHDVVEDTHFTLEDIENTFGKKIAYMVDGLTKIGGIIDSNVSQQAENFKKMLLTLSDDMRVILIKIADRLHNMRTLDHMPPHKQMKIASETLYVFAPLAHRLGIRSIRKELEDLSLRHLNPLEYKSIKEKVASTEEQVHIILENFNKPIEEKLEKAGYKFTISGRQKSIFSIWQKMQRKQLSFEDVYDKLAVRIVFQPKEGVSEISQCWEIYSIINSLYRKKADRTRDWITTPRPTGYEALHVTVMADSGDWVEVQIRSQRMDDIAERGTAAHWGYKQGGGDTISTDLDRWLTEIRVLFENPDSDALSFLDDFKLGLYYDEIQIFTPKGDMFTLPKGSTVLDFAYKIHTDLGNKCIGAKVDRKTQPINYELNTAEQVEILTSEKQEPEEEWLNFVVTPRAKSRLRNIFKVARKEKTNEGLDYLEHIFEKNKFKSLDNEALNKLIENLKAKNKEQLLLDIANGLFTEKDIRKAYMKSDAFMVIPYTTLKISNPFKRKKTKVEEERITKERVIDKRATLQLRDDKVNEEYTIAQCCQPIPGDEVIGFITANNSVEIHKRKCRRIVRLSSRLGDRLVSAHWTQNNLKSFLAFIYLRGTDRPGLLRDISNIISEEHGVNIKGISVETVDGVFEGEIKLYVPHVVELNDLISKLTRISGVTSVRRKEVEIEID